MRLTKVCRHEVSSHTGEGNVGPQLRIREIVVLDEANSRIALESCQYICSIYVRQ